MSENTKRKIIYYVVTITGLILLAVMAWNSPVSKSMIQESILLMSALFTHSGEIITSPFFIGIVLVIVLIFIQAIYPTGRKRRRTIKQETINQVDEVQEAKDFQAIEAQAEIEDIHIPTRQKDLEKWKEVYPIIKPMRTQSKTWAQIKDKIFNDHPGMPYDEDTLKKIYDAGNAGKLNI